MKPKPPPVRGKPFQSKLQPFTEVIRTLRQQRKTYPDIARILAEEHGVKAAASTIHEFVRVRARRPQGVYALPEPAATSEQMGATGVTTAEEPLTGTAAPAPKKFIFQPRPKAASHFDDEDLQFNDPLK